MVFGFGNWAYGWCRGGEGIVRLEKMHRLRELKMGVYAGVKVLTLYRSLRER